MTEYYEQVATHVSYPVDFRIDSRPGYPLPWLLNAFHLTPSTAHGPV